MRPEEVLMRPAEVFVRELAPEQGFRRQDAPDSVAEPFVGREAVTSRLDAALGRLQGELVALEFAECRYGRLPALKPVRATVVAPSRLDPIARLPEGVSHVDGPEQAASSWDAMADVLRRFVGGASVEWRESDGERQGRGDPGTGRCRAL